MRRACAGFSMMVVALSACADSGPPPRTGETKAVAEICAQVQNASDTWTLLARDGRAIIKFRFDRAAWVKEQSTSLKGRTPEPTMPPGVPSTYTEANAEYDRLKLQYESNLRAAAEAANTTTDTELQQQVLAARAGGTDLAGSLLSNLADACGARGHAVRKADA